LHISQDHYVKKIEQPWFWALMHWSHIRHKWSTIVSLHATSLYEQFQW